MDELINKIINSNQKFVSSAKREFFENQQESQSPFVTLVTCADSRVQVEVINEDAFNKFFVVRNIGNQIFSNEGSIDYGVLNLKTPILMILGHSDCGAVKAFLDGYSRETKPIIKVLDQLIPGISHEDKDLLSSIIQNVNYQVGIAVNKYSNIIETSELTVVGALYDFRNELKKGYGKLILLNINGEVQPY